LERLGAVHRRAAAVLTALALGAALGGCGTLSRALRAEPGPVPVAAAAMPSAIPVEETAPTRRQQEPFVAALAERGPLEPMATALMTTEASPDLAAPAEAMALAPEPPRGLEDERATVLAETATVASAAPAQVIAQAGTDRDPADIELYDPWEPFNEKMFEFNRQLDRWVLKPVAKAYNFVMPEIFQIMIANGFDNLNFPQRFLNSLFQGKFGGASRELGRFLVNSTVGVGGLFYPARDYLKWPKSREDFGQTLGFYGSGPGPYLILPFMEPLTVRDGIGRAVDGLMDPLSYVVPFIWARLGMKVGETVNDRSLNLELFQGFEETVIDMYSAVRHGYLQRREQLIRE
jgi:phospholipid-binding lipoprotein MlaA